MTSLLNRTTLISYCGIISPINESPLQAYSYNTPTPGRSVERRLIRDRPPHTSCDCEAAIIPSIGGASSSAKMLGSYPGDGAASSASGGGHSGTRSSSSPGSAKSRKANVGDPDP